MLDLCFVWFTLFTPENMAITWVFLASSSDNDLALEMLTCAFSSFSFLRTVFFLYIYLWPCWVFVALQAFLQLRWVGATLQWQCTGFSFRWLLLSTGSRMQAAVVPMPRLQRIGSIVMTHRLSCFLACGMLPGQGSSPCLLRCETDSFPLSHVGSLSSALSVCESLCSFHCLTSLLVGRGRSTPVFSQWRFGLG